jgi:hypothetical protein
MTFWGQTNLMNLQEFRPGIRSRAETYFIPAGVIYGWETFDMPARILNVSVKQS